MEKLNLFMKISILSSNRMDYARRNSILNVNPYSFLNIYLSWLLITFYKTGPTFVKVVKRCFNTLCNKNIFHFLTISKWKLNKIKTNRQLCLQALLYSFFLHFFVKMEEDFLNCLSVFSVRYSEARIKIYQSETSTCKRLKYLHIDIKHEISH